MLIVVILLVIIIGALIVYNYVIYKKLNTFKNINQKVIGLNVLQDFMSTIGNQESTEEKIKRINEILIEQYNIKYSTIVVFDGTTYVVKATNVDEKHWNSLTNLHNEEIFKDSITTATPKYITVNNENERLPYQQMEFGRAKSAMFFPLYIDNVYIGYWIIESSEMHAFDKIDTTILDVVKENILAVFKSISYQSIIETIQRKDLFTELNSAEYLYGKGRNIIDKYTTSTVGMFRITNLEEINNKYNRETGNQVVIQVADYIKNSLAEEYLFVRYMGPKFVIVFSGVEEDGVADFVVDLKKEVEDIQIKVVNKNEKETTKTKTKKKKTEEYVTPKLNFALSKYYKGTALENVTKNLEEYLDNADKEENEINRI